MLGGGGMLRQSVSFLLPLHYLVWITLSVIHSTISPSLFRTHTSVADAQ